MDLPTFLCNGEKLKAVYDSQKNQLLGHDLTLQHIFLLLTFSLALKCVTHQFAQS